jgi:hypothetical protein
MPMQDAIQILGFAKAVPTSVAATDAATINVPQIGVGYVVTSVLCYNAVGNNATATLGVFGAAAGAAPIIVADAALTTHTAANVVSSRTIAATATTPVVTSDFLTIRVGTASGVAGSTIDIVIAGYALP